MKKVSLCIGAFLVLFLISGVYNAQSQDYAVLNQMNGKWLKFNGSVKGYDFGVFHDPAGKADKFQGTLNQIYACVSYNPANETADMYVYDKAGTQTGWGVLYWESGTTDDWLSWIDLHLVSTGDPYPANNTDVFLWAPVITKTTNSAEKGSFKAFGLQGYINDNATSYGWFAGSMKASIVTKLPFMATNCAFVPPPM